MNLLEYRLYFDQNGKVLFYTCEKPEGNYIVIDKDTYANGRFDIKIMDGKIFSIYDKKIISKLVLNDAGTSCLPDDVSVVFSGNNSKKWKLKIYES
jgi:hypothetical protein